MKIEFANMLSDEKWEKMIMLLPAIAILIDKSQYCITFAFLPFLMVIKINRKKSSGCDGI